MTHTFRSSSASPLLTVKRARDAIAYYCSVFGAVERFRLIDPNDGRIGNAELRIGDGVIMLADEYPEVGALGPQSDEGTKARLHLYVADAKSVLEEAVSKGATSVRPLEMQFFGDLMGVVEDPFGHEWMIAQAVDDVSPAEMQARWNAMAGG